jgi:hypothetical protein
MSIDHKAYLFRHDAFQKELADLLHRSLQTAEVGPLREFIDCHRKHLMDRGTDESLGENWEDEYGAESDVQVYADLALSKYFDLTEDLGFSYGFDALGAYLATVPPLAPVADCLICGNLFGPAGRRLDTGSMGTGLLSAEEAAGFADLLAGTDWPTIPGPDSGIYAECYYKPGSARDVEASRDRLLDLYCRAAKAKMGILLMDYNDCGVSHL